MGKTVFDDLLFWLIKNKNDSDLILPKIMNEIFPI